MKALSKGATCLSQQFRIVPENPDANRIWFSILCIGPRIALEIRSSDQNAPNRDNA
jgi:hypothetical protein